MSQIEGLFVFLWIIDNADSGNKIDNFISTVEEVIVTLVTLVAVHPL